MSDKRKIGEVYYEIYATNDRLGAAVKQSGAHFRGLAGIAQQSNTDIARAVVGAAQQSESALHRVEAATGRVGTGFGLLRRAATGLGAVLGAREVLAYADTWTLVNNRLRLVTDGSQDLEAAQRRLFDVAQDTRTGYEATAETFTRLSRNSKELEKTQGELLDVTETINQALRVSGGSATSAQAALVQLSQAFSSGVLRGEEFNSVMEQAPRLAEAIAAGLGVTIGELRRLAADGQLTSKAVVEALQSQAAVIDAEFQRMTGTVSESFTQLRNSAMRFVGEASEASGASVALAGGLSLVAQNFRTVANAALLFGAVAVSKGLGTAISQVRAWAGAQVEAATGVERAAKTSAIAAERAAAADLRKLRTEQQALVRAEQRTRADYNAVRAAEVAAKANLDVARTAQARAAAELQLEHITTRRIGYSKVLRDIEAQQIATSRLVGQAQIALGNAQNATAVAIGRTTLAARAGAVAVRGFSLALGLIGGIPGLIFTAIAGGFALIASRAAAARAETEKLRGLIGGLSDTALGNAASNHQARLTQLRQEQAAFEASVRGKRVLGDDGMVTDEGARIMARRKKLTEDIAAQERVISEVVGEQNERRRQGIQIEDEKQRDDRQEVERLAGLLGAEVATNKERARAAGLVREYRAELKSLVSSEGESEEKRAENQKRRIVLSERIKSLTEQERKELKGQGKDVDALTGIFERLAALDVRVQGGDSLAQLRLQLAGIEADAVIIGNSSALEEVRKQIEEIEAAAVAARKADLGMEMRQLLASMTTTAVDDMRVALEQLQKQLREKGASDGQIAVITELQERAIAAKQAAEELEETLRRQRERLDRLDSYSSLQPKSLKARFRVLGELEDEKRGLELKKLMADTDTERLGIQRQIDEVTGRITRHTEEGRQQLDEYTRSTAETQSSLQAIATEVAEITRGATAAARAFDLMGDSTATTLSDIANGVEGVTKLIASGGADVGAWVQTIGSAINLGANAFGLGKRDREEKANRAENAEVVKGLREFAGALAAAVDALGEFSGKTYDAVSQAVDDIVRQSEGRSGKKNIIGVDPVLQAFGATFDQLKAIAEAHRIDLDGTVDSYRRLSDAMQATRAAFAEFGTTLSEYQSYGALRDKAHGVTRSPADELRELLNAGGVASNPLGQLLGGSYLDGGLESLREQLQGIVDVLAPGGPALDPKLLGSMTPDEFRSYIGSLLDAISAVEEELAPATKGAAERLQEAIRATALALDFEDVTDPGERFRRSAAAFAATDAALASLTSELDLTTRDGIAAFDERIRKLAEDVQSGALAIDGFTADELLQALGGLEVAGDAAAEAMDAAARSLAEYTRKTEDDLDVQELRNAGQDAAADLLEFRRGLDQAYADAVEAGLSPETLARLKTSNDDQLRNFILSQQGDAAPEAAAERAGRSTVSGAERITEQTGTLIAGGINTLVSLTREQNALMLRVGALGGLPMPTIQPPLLPSAYLAGWGSGPTMAPAGGSASTGAGGIVVNQTVNFWAAVTGREDVRAGVRAGGADIAAELQRRVDTQRRVEGRPEVI